MSRKRKEGPLPKGIIGVEKLYESDPDRSQGCEACSNLGCSSVG